MFFSNDDLLKNYPIKVTVNSEDGIDLDKVDLWIYVNGDPQKSIHLLKTLDDKFSICYGGVASESASTTIVEYKSASKNTGVEPMNKAEGSDRFVYQQKFADLKLTDGKPLPVGKHKIVAKV